METSLIIKTKGGIIVRIYTWKSYTIFLLGFILMLNLIFLDAVSQISFIYDSFLWHLYGGYIPVSIVALFILMVISLLSKKRKGLLLYSLAYCY